MMVDFSVLKSPNYLALYRESHDQGRALAKDRGVQNALGSAAKDLGAAEQELIRYGAFEEAGQLRQIALNQARQRAAKAAQALNYDEAAAALADAGDAAGAAQMTQQGRARQIGGMVASGDRSGARDTALGAGDFDVAGAIENMDAGQRAKSLADGFERLDRIKGRNDTRIKALPEKAAKALAPIASALAPL